MRLKQLRKEKGLTQQEVADRLDCALNVYSRYERGERQPSIDMLLKLSNIFEVSIDYIVESPDALPRFTLYQQKFLKALNKADERSREDALNLLLSHQTEQGNITDNINN